jgi:hypothetical protein
MSRPVAPPNTLIFCSIAAVVLLGASSVADAQSTYYLSTSGSDSNSCAASKGSSAPKKTISSAAGCLAAGDTLVLGPGTYAGSSNAIGLLPSGSAGKYVTIQAETDGTVILTATVSVSGAYQTFAGLRFVNTDGEKAIDGNHLRFLRCAFVGGAASGNVINLGVGGSYNLLEDCWVYGSGGRYKVLVYRANHIVLRRVVVRDDAGWTVNASDPEAGIAVYESSSVSLQNCIAIDFDLNTYASTYTGPYYLTGHGGNPSSSNCEYLGNLALNYKGGGLYVDTDDGGTNLTIRDMVFYKGEVGLAASNTSIPMTVQRLTVGSQGSNQGVVNWSRSSMAVSDSVIFDTGASAEGASVSYTNTYNPADLSGTGITHLNPRTNGLLYLPRIESGSALKSGGASNGQRGAQVVSRIGTSGTVHGESGYNSDTGAALWPWPNEARIKQEMCTDAGVTRGFCSASSLTYYVMNQLGNGSPYSAGQGAPAAPANVKVLQ